jgi:hypothetical protein
VNRVVRRLRMVFVGYCCWLDLVTDPGTKSVRTVGLFILTIRSS